MKKGLSGTGISAVTFQNVFEFGLRSLSSWMVWCGILIYLGTFMLWLVIIYSIDLSIAMPVGAATYVFIPIAAIIFLHEHVSPLRWLGIALIIFGIYFISQSKRKIA